MHNGNAEGYRAGFVSVVGRPNVGKSTLINAFLGQKVAAVSPKPQTTRRNQLGILTLDRAQLIFTDTPGLHRERNKLGTLMNTEVHSALEDGDVILFVVDASLSPNQEDRLLADKIKSLGAKHPLLLALNKVDLLNAFDLEKRHREYGKLLGVKQGLPISATTGQGIADLLDTLVDLLPLSPPLFPEDQVTDLYERQIAADLIREASLKTLREEVPHGIAVRIDEFVERDEKGALIEATLFVEKDSHKGIVIGEGGSMIKAIGKAARLEIESMSGRKVFLRLRVKVRKNWRNDDKILDRFGYSRKKR